MHLRRYVSVGVWRRIGDVCSSRCGEVCMSACTAYSVWYPATSEEWYTEDIYRLLSQSRQILLKEKVEAGEVVVGSSFRWRAESFERWDGGLEFSRQKERSLSTCEYVWA